MRPPEPATTPASTTSAGPVMSPERARLVEELLVERYRPTPRRPPNHPAPAAAEHRPGR